MDSVIYDIKNMDRDDRITHIKSILDDEGIRVSHQRLLILEYLATHETHPSAEEIFKDLKSVDPVISQATVYNTLNLFTDKKIIKELDFNMSSKRYEFNKINHGHFICENCGMILDIEFDDFPVPALLVDFEVHSTEIVHRGLCPNCQ